MKAFERVARVVVEQVAAFGALLAWLVALAVGGRWLASLFGVDDAAYWGQAIPALAAVIGGIPLAIWGVRLAGRATGSKERRDAQQRRKTILSLLCDELQTVERDLLGARAERPRPLVYPPLKTASWDALSDGGELRWVDDPETISALANAYHRITSMRDLEAQLARVFRDPVAGASTSTGRIVAELQTILVGQDEHTIAAARVALQRIREAGLDCPEGGA